MKAVASGFARRLREHFFAIPRPLVAIEVRPGSVCVAKGRREKGRVVLVGAASVELPGGMVVPSLAESNIMDVEGLARIIRGAAERAGASDGGVATLLLPDPAVRVAMLNETEIGKARGAELEDVVRFRLRRAVPFDVREARVAIARVTHSALPSVAVLAKQSVVREYEGVVESCGFHVGVVEAAGLALTSAVTAAGGADVLLVDWDEQYVSIFVVRDNWPLLFRTVAGVGDETGELVHELRSTLLYCHEKLTGVAPSMVQVRVSGRLDALDRLEQGIGLPVRRLELGEGLPAEARGCGAALCVLLERAA